MQRHEASMWGPFEPPDYRKMFPRLRPCGPIIPASEENEGLRKLAESMIAPDRVEDLETKDPRTMPAGYTFFGQFIAHDVSFMRRSSPGVDIANDRSPRMDLDSVYGGGPRVSPFLYNARQPYLFLIGGSGEDSTRNVLDLPRNSRNTAIIPDPRNDVNVIVAQMHLAFMLAHNDLADQVKREDKNLSDHRVFYEARKRLLRHYPVPSARTVHSIYARAATH